jgi:hypothetical protein
MSVDALAFVPNKAAALNEVARILKAGSWFVFTTWDYQDGESIGITAPQVADHRPLLEAVGFAVAVYEATPRGEQFERALYQAVLAAEDELINEMGEAPLGQASVRLATGSPCSIGAVGSWWRHTPSNPVFRAGVPASSAAQPPPGCG